MSRRFVVEADGGSRGNPGPAAYGALVRDAETQQVLAREGRFIGVASNNVAEYGGLIAGLRLATALDPHASIEVRMDSKLVVEQMSGRWKVKHADMQRLAREAREVVDPSQVRYTWVPRAQNKDADRLANEALDDAQRGLPWRGEQPPPAAVSQEGPRVEEPLPPDVGQPTTLLALRHGVTELTSQRRFSGAGGADLPLTELGQQQAVAAASVLRAAGGVDAVVCSPLRRARETADVVAQVLGLSPRVDEGWTECAFGSWDGLTAAEVAQRWPYEHREWLASTSVAPPGGESLDDLVRRIRLAKDRLVARYPRRRVLVVSHVGPIKALVQAALQAPAQVQWRLESSPASVTTTSWWSDGNSAVVSFNETGHLHAAGLALR